MTKTSKPLIIKVLDVFYRTPNDTILELFLSKPN